MIDVMLDLETLGNSSRAAIASIGLCVFGAGEKTGYYAQVDLADAMKHGEADASTLTWWLQQSDEARAGLTVGDRLPLSFALTELVRWYPKGLTRLWCHATFDAPIIDHAFARTGVTRPWPYRSVRDLRTLYDIAEQLNVAIPDRKGVHHHALDDAIFQATGAAATLAAIKRRLDR
jgi:exodeoxyribonuclease VIII